MGGFLTEGETKIKESLCSTNQSEQKNHCVP